MNAASNLLFRGVVHGRTIELDRDPGIEDGKTIELMIQPRSALGPPPGWFPGCTETAGGMLAESWTEEDDRALDEIHGQRNLPTRRGL